MKKIFVLLMAIGLMLTQVPTVLAGGDQNRGDIGAGTTNEYACENQPCFEDAPKPGSSSTLIQSVPDPTNSLGETELDHLTGLLTGHK